MGSTGDRLIILRKYVIGPAFYSIIGIVLPYGLSNRPQSEIVMIIMAVVFFAAFIHIVMLISMKYIIYLLLLAPSGALVVIMVYYIHINPVFQIFQIL